MATVSASFWGAFCIRQQHPTRGYRIFETMNGFEPWSTLLTPCSPDPWVLLHHRFFNDTHELKSAKLDAAFCQSFYILHIRKHVLTKSFEDSLLGSFWKFQVFCPKRPLGHWPVESTWTCHRCQRHRANPMLVALAVAHLAAEKGYQVTSHFQHLTIINHPLKKGINGI